MKFVSALSFFLPVAGAIVCFAAETQQRPVAIRGNIVSITGDELVVAAADGPLVVKVSDSTTLRKETALSVADIKPGMYLGTTAKKQTDGTFRSSEVHVFSEDERGVGEGHRPSSSTPGSTMTNANVEGVEHTIVQDVKGSMLTLKYKAGEVRVFVPPETPIVQRVPADRAALNPGATVAIQAVRSADGSISASQITVRAQRSGPPA